MSSEIQRCAGKKWSNWAWVQCSKNAGESGYCGIHDPKKVAVREKKRLDKSNAAYEAYKAERERERVIRTTTEEIVAFVRALSEDSRSVPWAVTARQLIAKLEGR